MSKVSMTSPPPSVPIAARGTTKQHEEEEEQRRMDALVVEMLQQSCRNGEVQFVFSICLAQIYPPGVANQSSLHTVPSHVITRHHTSSHVQVMSVYRVLEHAPPALVNVAPPGGSAPIFEAINGQHW
jgi:hypothetical protein